MTLTIKWACLASAAVVLAEATARGIAVAQGNLFLPKQQLHMLILGFASQPANFNFILLFTCFP